MSKSLTLHPDVYIRKVLVGNFVVIDLPLKYSKFVRSKRKIIINGCYLLKIKQPLTIEIEGVVKPMYFCKIIKKPKPPPITTNIVYARCKNSMKILDRIHRKFIIEQLKFKPKQVIAIKSVAGSGKTTTLLKLAETHADKNILYLAFNKSLIGEIKTKLRKQGITNVVPKTFDSLMRDVYIHNSKDSETEPELIYLNHNTIKDVSDFFKNKFD